VARYLRLLGVQLRASTLLALQYRWEFLGSAALALFWVGWSLVPILVVFGHRLVFAWCR
jgi:ABC-2 type transport system permease protein